MWKAIVDFFKGLFGGTKHREIVRKGSATPVAQDPSCCDVPAPNAHGPCDVDYRDGKFDPNWDPATANAHGYFWCSLAKQTLDKSINAGMCNVNQYPALHTPRGRF